jgi:DNA-binding transcriptional MerR regulator
MLSDRSRAAAAGERRLPIGMFARITRLTRKALKTYERCGLLVPAEIDPETHYRFYGLGQIQDAETIRLLRSVGVPLREIASVLRKDDATPLADMLRHRRAELAAGLATTDRLITQLESATSATVDAGIAITEVPEHTVVIRAAQCTQETHETVVDRLIEEVATVIEEADLRTLARETATYFADFDLTRDYRVEVSVPIDVSTRREETLPSSWRWVPDATIVGCVHQGPYDEIHSSLARLIAWAAERNLPLSGRFCETYLVDERDADDPDAFRTALGLVLARDGTAPRAP